MFHHHKFIQNYFYWLQNQKDTRIKVVRIDNGEEYIGHEFKDLCCEYGITHQTTAPYTPECNGITERYNRTLQEGALVLQYQAGFSNRFWVSSIHTISMGTLHTHINMTPYKAFWGVKPGINWLCTCGCKCWVMIPKQRRRKGEYKSIEGVFIGYYDNSKAYKVWIPCTQTLMKSRDVIFDESNHIECTEIHGSNDDELPNSI